MNLMKMVVMLFLLVSGCLDCLQAQEMGGSDSALLVILGGFNQKEYRPEVCSVALSHLQKGKKTVWEDEPSLPFGIQGHTSLVVGDQVVVIGGFGGFSADGRPRFSSGVFCSRVADGHLGPWIQNTYLPHPLGYHAAVLHGRTLLLSGGQSPSDVSAVYRGGIGPDGRVTAWEKAGDLPRPMRGHGSVMAGDRLFVLGGHDNEGYFDQVFSAQVVEGGSLGSWQEAKPLPLPLVHFGLAFCRGRIYIFGGQTAEGRLRRGVYSAAVSGGKLGSWRREPFFDFPQARMAINVVGDRIIASGGGYGWGPPVYSDILAADLKADGGLGRWRKIGRLPRPLAFHGAVLLTEK